MLTKPKAPTVPASPSNSERELLEARQVGLTIEAHAILDSISLETHQGEFIGVIGANGAGKSTLIKCISGLLSPTSGEVCLDGKDLSRLSPKQIARAIAHLPQNAILDFGFTCMEVVLMGRNPHLGPFQLEGKKDQAIARDAMTFTDTAQFATRAINTLSGGERQRVLISRALAQEPRLLLLDEPTSNLDIQHQLQVMDLVRRLVDGGMTALAAMHDLSMAARYCDRLLMLCQGKVVAAGSPEETLTPQNIEQVFGVKAWVYTDPLTGSLTVSVLNATAEQDNAPKMQGRVHVIAGGGRGSRPMYMLKEAGFEVTAGVLSTGDSDYHTAQMLAVPCPHKAPFSPHESACDVENLELVAQADVVIVTTTCFGEANLSNLVAASHGARLVLIEEGPFAERDYTGGKATILYNRMREHAIVTAELGLIAAVKQALSSQETNPWLSIPSDTQPA